MLLSEIIYNIRNILESGVSSDDFSLSDRQIAFIIGYYRAKIIKQQVDNGQSISDKLFQSFGRIEVELSDRNNESTITYSILKTTKPVPKIASAGKRDLVAYVGGLDGKSPYQRMSPIQSVWKCYRKFTSKLPTYYQLNEHYYLENCNGLQKYFTIFAVAEDPLVLQEYLDAQEDCDSGFDFEYPISADMLDMIYAMMMEKELNLLLTVFKDNTNDSSNIPSNKEN